MTKPKTKLVCVGWGIWWRETKQWENTYKIVACMPKSKHDRPPPEIWDTRSEAIREFNSHHMYYDRRGNPDYNRYPKMRRWGLVIAKKLWVEVKDE